MTKNGDTYSFKVSKGLLGLNVVLEARGLYGSKEEEEDMTSHALRQ